MAERNRKKLTPFEKEKHDTIAELIEKKKAMEANVVGLIYKKPELLYETNLTTDDFHDNVWRVYYEIIYNLVIKEKKNVINDVVVGVYLEKHEKLRAVYEDKKGYALIDITVKHVNIENFDAYVSEIRKFNALIKLCGLGFPVRDRISEFMDMSAEEIYDEYMVKLNHTFTNVDADVKSYKLSDGIYDLIDKLNEGQALGLPFYDLPTLTNETGGQCLGTITLLGGVSNAGKSTVARSATIPSIIKLKSSVVIMINEDSFEKWQREMLVWVANNILHFDLQKHTVRNGNYSKEVVQKLKEAADWIHQQEKDSKIIIVPFLQYRTDKAIKIIRKYAAMGVEYFVLDTFKMDAGEISQNSWLQMQQSMVNIKDTIKSESLNVHILITFQLEKGSSVMRYYTQNNIGMAKNIVDVASTCIMIRDIFDDEYEDGKHKLKVYRVDKLTNNTTKNVVQHLDKNKKYQVFFIVKNQEGAANSYQIVVEHDKSRNVIREIGRCNIIPNF